MSLVSVQEMEETTAEDDADNNYFERYVKKIISRHSGRDDNKTKSEGDREGEVDDADAISRPDFKFSVTGYGYGGDVSNTETVQAVSSFSSISGVDCDAKNNNGTKLEEEEPGVIAENETQQEEPEVAEMKSKKPEKPDSKEPAMADPNNQPDGDKVAIDKMAADKPYYKFANNIQQALSTLNNQMSTTLRDSIVNIDEISNKVRKCLGEMDKHTKIYYSQFQNNDEIEPTVLISPLPNDEITPIIETAESVEIMANCLEQKEKRNQKKSATPPVADRQNEENRPRSRKKPKSTERTPNVDTARADPYEEAEMALEKAHEDFKKGVKELQNCMKKACDEQGRSQKYHSPIISPRMKFDGDCFDQTCGNKKERDFKMYVDKCRRNYERNGYPGRKPEVPMAPPPTPADSYNFGYPPAPSKLMDVTKILKTVDVNLAKGKPIHNLNEKLRNQINASDSLQEFQIQMKRKPKTLLKISAEELFVPEKNINKITKKSPPDKPSSGANNDKLASKAPPLKGGKGRKKPQPKTAVDVAKRAPPVRGVQKQKQAPPGVAPRKAVITGEKKFDNSLWFPSMGANEQKKNDAAAAPKCNRSVYSELKQQLAQQATSTLTTEKTPQIKQISLTSSCQMPWMRTTKSGQVLNCFDILDELTTKDVEPIQSEYPRKDEIDAMNANNKIENSYLYKLTYGKNINVDTAMAELFGGKNLEPSLECAQPNCTTCRTGGKIKQHRFKTKPGVKATSSEKANQKIQQYHHGDRRIKSDRNVGGKIAPPPKRSEKKNLTGSHVAEKLKPYLRDPQLRYPTTITIMPVRVTYTNMTPLPNANLNSARQQHENVSSMLGVKKSEQCGDFEGKKTTTMRFKGEKRQMAAKQVQEQFSPLPSPQKKFAPNSGKVPKPKTPTSIPTNNSAPRRKSTPPKTLSKVANDSRRMLSDIQTLAHKNNSLLQMNIQKVIAIIEGKIVDILSDPKKHNADAFQVVENEIKDVLEMMRTMDSSGQKGGKRKKPAKDTEKKKTNAKSGTSDDMLLAKLQAIADVDPSADEGSTSETNATMQSLPTPSLGPNPMLLVEKDNVIKPPIVASYVNSHVTDDTSSQLTIIRDDDGNVSENEEKCVVTSACSPRKTENVHVSNEKVLTPRKFSPRPSKPNVESHTKNADDSNATVTNEVKKEPVEPVKSDMFLTPFMQAIKQRMNSSGGDQNNDKNSSGETPSTDIAEEEPKASFHHIIQFLDTLTNISQELATSVTVYYKCTVNVPMVYHGVTVYYEVKQHYTITYRDAPVLAEKHEPRRLLSGIFRGNFPTNLKSLITKDNSCGESPKATITSANTGDCNDLLIIDPKRNKALNLTLYTVTSFCDHPMQMYRAPRKRPRKNRRTTNTTERHRSNWKPITSGAISKGVFSRDLFEGYVLDVTYACIFTLLYIALTVNMPGI